MIHLSAEYVRLIAAAYPTQAWPPTGTRTRTVRQLVAELRRLPGDWPVVVSDGDHVIGVEDVVRVHEAIVAIEGA